MRFYDITVGPAASPAYEWTSYHGGPNGQFDPNAQDVAFDAIVAGAGSPAGLALPLLTIYGVPLDVLEQATQFTGLPIVVTAGMAGGMPLETPSQVGIVLAGQVFQSFGNWVGTEMTLDFVVAPALYTLAKQGSFTVAWRKGQQLADALATTLSAAYAGSSPQISANIKLANTWTRPTDIIGQYATLNEMAQMITTHTASDANGPVVVAPHNTIINIYDKSSLGATVKLQFQDLVGQPTWIGVNEVQLKVVLRGDLNLGSIISMPQGYLAQPGLVQISQAAYPSQLRYKPTFSSSFVVTSLRHVAQFRSSDAGEWATIINAVVYDAS